MSESTGVPEPDLRAMAIGDALVALHDRFRRQLAQIRQAAEEHHGGTRNTAMTDLRTHCLAFCEQLHAHHSEEDRSLFPHLRGLDPELRSVLDRLGHEHRVVARGLSDLQGALDDCDADASAEDREHLRARLRDISGTIEAHLDYEEQQLVPLLNTLTQIPGADGPDGP